jgi:hypothetical protein
MAGRWRKGLRRVVDRLLRRPPAASSPGPSLVQSSVLPPEPAAPPPADNPAVELSTTDLVRLISEDTRERGVDKDADQRRAAEDLVAAVGPENAVELAEQQNRVTQEYGRGHYLPGNERWANQIAIMQRMTGRAVRIGRVKKWLVASDYEQWFWYHGKRTL